MFHIALSPAGALSQVVMKGEWPCAMAYGVQPSHQVNSDVSGPPICAEPMCRNSGQYSQIDSAVNTNGAAMPAR